MGLTLANNPNDRPNFFLPFFEVVALKKPFATTPNVITIQGFLKVGDIGLKPVQNALASFLSYIGSFPLKYNIRKLGITYFEMFTDQLPDQPSSEDDDIMFESRCLPPLRI
jgi:hypothetical protein